MLAQEGKAGPDPLEAKEMKRVLAWIFTLAVFASTAGASTVTATITGTMLDGTDTSGVFGLGANADLTGQSYTLVFTFDDTAGVEFFTGTGYSFIEATGTSNPGTATLTINGNSFTFAVDATTGNFTSIATQYGPPSYTSGINYNAGDGGLSDGSYVVTETATSNTSLLTGTWESNVVSAALDPSQSAGYFTINEVESSQVANGDFYPETLSVSGPGCDTPTGETVSWSGWDSTYPSAGDWVQTLTGGGSYVDRTVTETDASTGEDSCYFSTSSIAEITSFSSLGRAVSTSINSSDQWGDLVGWLPSNVSYYRTQAGLSKTTLPCGFVLHQQMQFTCADNTVNNYGSVHDPLGIIGSSYVGSNKNLPTPKTESY